MGGLKYSHENSVSMMIRLMLNQSMNALNVVSRQVMPSNCPPIGNCVKFVSGGNNLAEHNLAVHNTHSSGRGQIFFTIPKR